MNALKRWVFTHAAARCYADSAVADAPVKSEVVDADSGLPKEEPAADPAPTSDRTLPFGTLDDTYFSRNMGSKDVNPDGRLLRPDVRNQVSDDELDDVIKAMGDAAFMTAKEIAAYENAKPADKADGDTVDNPAPTDKKPVDKKPAEKDDEDVSKFFTEIGIKREEFDAMPEPVRKRLVEMHEKKPTSDIPETYKKEHDENKKLIENFRRDPVIRARIEEVTTGKRYVAYDLPKVAESEISQSLVTELSLEASDVSKITAEVNRLLAVKAKDAVKSERSVADRESSLEAARKDAWGVVCEIGKIDKRLEVTDPVGMYDNPPDADTEVGRLIDFVAKARLSLDQVKTLGPKKLYALYAAEKGWDVQRDKNIETTVRKSLWDKISNPKKATMRSIPQGKPPVGTDPVIPGSTLDEDGLVKELLSGKSQSLERLVEIHSSNPAMLERLKGIQIKARQQYLERRQKRNLSSGEDE